MFEWLWLKEIYRIAIYGAKWGLHGAPTLGPQGVFSESFIETAVLSVSADIYNTVCGLSHCD